MKKEARILSILPFFLLMSTCRSLPATDFLRNQDSSKIKITYSLNNTEDIYHIKFTTGETYSIKKTNLMIVRESSSKYQESALAKLIKDQFTEEQREIVSHRLYSLLGIADLNKDYLVDIRDLLTFFTLRNNYKFIDDLDKKATELADAVHFGGEFSNDVRKSLP